MIRPRPDRPPGRTGRRRRGRLAGTPRGASSPSGPPCAILSRQATESLGSFSRRHVTTRALPGFTSGQRCFTSSAQGSSARAAHTCRSATAMSRDALANSPFLQPSGPAKTSLHGAAGRRIKSSARHSLREDATPCLYAFLFSPLVDARNKSAVRIAWRTIAGHRSIPLKPPTKPR